MNDLTNEIKELEKRKLQIEYEIAEKKKADEPNRLARVKARKQQIDAARLVIFGAAKCKCETIPGDGFGYRGDEIIRCVKCRLDELEPKED